MGSILIENTMCEALSLPNMIELVRQHHALLFRYAYRLSGSAVDAEDLTQETYLQACRKIDQLRDPGSAKGWLCTILRNCYLKRLRDKEHTEVPLGQALQAIPAPNPVATATFGIDSDQLQKALGALPEPFRSPLIWFYFEEFSYQEIADQMNVPVGTVMSRLSRAKAHLRQELLEAAKCGSTSDSVTFPI